MENVCFWSNVGLNAIYKFKFVRQYNLLLRRFKMAKIEGKFSTVVTKMENITKVHING